MTGGGGGGGGGNCIASRRGLPRPGPAVPPTTPSSIWRGAPSGRVDGHPAAATISPPPPPAVTEQHRNCAGVRD